MGNSKIKLSREDHVMNSLANTVVIVCLILTLYPLWYCVVYAFNDGVDSIKGGVYFWPRAFTLDNFALVLRNGKFLHAFAVTVARTVLARLLFFEKDMKKPAGVLSGGERIKLAFAKLFVSRVNLLILDEPTNYLDIPSIEALEAMFSEYEGTLVFVSHDEAFIRRVATDVLEVADGKIIHHDMPSGTPPWRTALWQSI